MANAAVISPKPNNRSLGARFIAYIRKYWFVYMLILPGFVCMCVFDYGPMYGIQLAFKDYSPRLGVWGSPWTGLSHFKEMLVDPSLSALSKTRSSSIYITCSSVSPSTCSWR
ncbi:MAG: hypothetical protein Q4G19_05445 [Clostridia bacterium]|nr:hypothetical protein [Clostridia bacterium]